MEDFSAIDILIVDNNPGDSDKILRVLRKINLANNVYVTNDGDEALDFVFCREKFEARNFDNPPKVILLELNLPKISGFEIIRLIRKDNRTQHIPIVVATSSLEKIDRKMAYELGVNSYVIKPVVFEQFVNTMSSIGLYWLMVNEPSK